MAESTRFWQPGRGWTVGLGRCQGTSYNVAMPTLNAESILGRHPDQLSLEERRMLAGTWIATEIYSPETTPLRCIEAIGGSVAECITMLRRRGLDPAKFEFSLLRPPY